ncbi:hypothetical protein FGO68_gene7462 [Halteria grandinella]|uniref:Uncharacterized protein n=1 Tax=Halteria grandinella TaxID=5974 RepID=A0A8J8TA00_HALGN|nr:hypothetical protein FGO68_gene7462 [Halteria grandinella]
MRIPRHLLYSWRLQTWMHPCTTRQVNIQQYVLEIASIVSHSELNQSLPYSKWTQELGQTYQLSLLNSNAIFPNKSSEIPGCLKGQNYCQVCEIGQYINLNNQCVKQCGQGWYGEMQTIQAEEQIQIISSKCQRCSYNCLTCINGLENGCTSCQLGYQLTFNDLVSGTCKPYHQSLLQFENYKLHVTGQRAQGNDEANFKFADLLSALKHAYKLHLVFSNLQKVTILISENVDHFITAYDFSNSYPLIEDESLLNGSYLVEIMQALLIQFVLGHWDATANKIMMGALQKQK